MAQRGQKSVWGYIIVGVVAVLVVLGLANALQRPPETTADRLGNAANEFSDGVRDAGRELDPDRSFGERMGETLEDAGSDLQDAASD